MDVAHVREVLHARSNATQHAHQLEGGKLAIMVLEGGNDSGSVFCFMTRTRRNTEMMKPEIGVVPIFQYLFQF